MELQLCRFFKKFVSVAKFEIVYSTVRCAALRGAPEEAEIMQNHCRSLSEMLIL